MNRYTVLTLGLALALPCVGAWAIDNGNAGAAGDQGTQLQAPAAPDQNQTPAPPTATPQDQAPPNTAPPDQNAAPPNNPPADQNAAPPNNAAPNNAAPDNTQPNNPPPAVAPSDQRQPNPAPGAAPANAGTYSSPLQQFMSDQVNEVGELSQQIDQFRAAKRPEAVMALYHMIRDHTLVADAARNVLARRGEVSEPTFMPMQAIGNSPDEILQYDIQAHQETLSQLQQMLANASSPEEKNIYQRAINATNKHLNWLTAMNQGQPVQIGFFGPTTPLNRIAGYRAEQPAARVAGYQESQPSRISRTHRRIHHRRHRRYSRVRYYR